MLITGRQFSYFGSAYELDMVATEYTTIAFHWYPRVGVKSCSYRACNWSGY